MVQYNPDATLLALVQQEATLADQEQTIEILRDRKHLLLLILEAMEQEQNRMHNLSDTLKV